MSVDALGAWQALARRVTVGGGLPLVVEVIRRGDDIIAIVRTVYPVPTAGRPGEIAPAQSRWLVTGPPSVRELLHACALAYLHELAEHAKVDGESAFDPHADSAGWPCLDEGTKVRRLLDTLPSRDPPARK